jgi:excisionase family DNA binding protein
MTLLTQRQAAAVLGLSERTVERMRVAGNGPRFVRMGRSIRYRPADIENWIASRVVSSTSEPIHDQLHH